jgi:hypothetical protein
VQGSPKQVNPLLPYRDIRIVSIIDLLLFNRDFLLNFFFMRVNC